MKRTVLVTVAALGSGFALGHVGLADPAKPATVAAKHYRIVWAESTLELSHGGGEWIDEYFLPDAKVVADVHFEYPPWDSWKAGTPAPARRARVFAFPAEKPRNDLVGLRGGKPTPIDDVELPTALAQRVIDLAALQKRAQDEGLALGKDLAENRTLVPLPSADEAPAAK